MRSKFAAIVILTLDIATPQGVACVPCNFTSDCESLFRPGSICVNEACTNPFASGCLRRVLGEELFPRTRSCNSDDLDGAEEAGVCSPSRFGYNEIRIHPGNWDSSVLYAWIVQIVLSELADVPVSIELGDGLKSGSERKLSFYDPQNAFSYPSFSPESFESMREGDHVRDCRLNFGNGRLCSHFMPEVWLERRNWFREATAEGYIERPSWNGMLGGSHWFVPRFLGEEHPSLTTHWGLRGESNRRKLAHTFKRPTTWGYYCQHLSPTACKKDDGVAVRPPEGEAERARYFVDGLYTGHFRYTTKNNCTMNPTNCTGHIADYPCEWTPTYTQSVLHWNNIALESDGPSGLSTYPYNAMVEIIRASNATRSPMVLVWWSPEVNVETYKLQPVDLPMPTAECLRNRPDFTEFNGKGSRCHLDKIDLIGTDPSGGCGPETQPLLKVIVSSLAKETFHQHEAIRSPAYKILKDISVSEMSIISIMDEWRRRRIDTYGYDPREAVCSWVIANVDELKEIVPSGYPREKRVMDFYDSPLLHAAMALGAVVAAMALVTLLATWYLRKSAVMKYAQVDFLYMFCVGNLFVSVAGIVVAMVPSSASCTATPWLLVLGYTLGLVPLLVKAAAINKLVLDARKMKRARIPRKHLYCIVAVSVALAVAYLIAWTVVDGRTRLEEYVLIGGEENNVVEVHLDCSSASRIWAVIAFVWEALLIFGATLLSFQSGSVRQEFNESKILGNMAYSRFLFLSFRILVYFGMSAVDPKIRNGILSLLLSFDSLFSLLIYFGPKLLLALGKTNPNEVKPGSTESSPSPTSGRPRVVNDPVKVASQSVPIVNVDSTENARDGDCNEHYHMVALCRSSAGCVADKSCIYRSKTPLNMEGCPQVCPSECNQESISWSQNIASPELGETMNAANEDEQVEKRASWFRRASGVVTRKSASKIVQRASTAFASRFLAEY